MKNKRRDFLKYSGLAGLGMAGGIMKGFSADNKVNYMSGSIRSALSED
ncbi:MAG TPA: twin-arginine translocation signal domain-containing protein, partial [Puia sp.]|nr:twin-arginine translocation signal domain-containing protein [Puia sp.]